MSCDRVIGVGKYFFRLPVQEDVSKEKPTCELTPECRDLREEGSRQRGDALSVELNGGQGA